MTSHHVRRGPGRGRRGRRSSRRLRSLACLAVVGTAVGVTSCGDGASGDDGASEPEGQGVVTVFAAASLTDAFEAAADAFETDHSGVTVELNLAGSPALREQILGGAPADVVALAAPDDMDRLAEADRVAGEVRVFARNTLAIAVPAGNPGDVRSLQDFADDDLLIGLCAAEVPCGALARDALAQADLDPAPDTDEPDVRSLLAKVVAGELDAGLVYRSDVVAAGDAVDGIDLPTGVEVGTSYPVATLARAEAPALATAFVDFLLSADGQAILATAGFEAP